MTVLDEYAEETEYLAEEERRDENARLQAAQQGRKKPKNNRKGDEATSMKMDRCGTPRYALDPLLPYLDPSWVIWESAEGKGHIYVGLYRAGFERIIGTDLLTTGTNFIHDEPFTDWDCQVTNPPYSIKYKWLKRSYALGKPFALLLPVDTSGASTAQKLFREYGCEIIYMDKRVNFDMPDKGYAGQAQFATAWYTWGLNIGRENTYAHIERCSDEEWVPWRS